jgi:hypothetical protein
VVDLQSLILTLRPLSFSVLKYTHDNLAYWADRGCGPSIVVLHINLNHSGQRLFYRFLHNSLTPPDSPSSPHDTTPPLRPAAQ